MTGRLLEMGAYFDILKNRNSEIKSIKNNKFLDSLDRIARTSHNFSFDMFYEIKFKTTIRGHHVYKAVWIPR